VRKDSEKPTSPSVAPPPPAAVLEALLEPAELEAAELELPPVAEDAADDAALAALVAALVAEVAGSETPEHAASERDRTPARANPRVRRVAVVIVR
jgi:hypothetical protein